MKLMVDLDGVLAKFDKEYRALLHEQRDEPCPDLTGWDPDCWGWDEKLGFSKEEIDAAWQAVDNPINHFWLYLEPYEDAAVAIDRLDNASRTGTEVYFMTARHSGTAKLQSERWLAKHGMDHPTVISTKRKGLICKALDIDYAIDDRDRNAIQIATDSPKTKVFLLARPWNRELQACAGDHKITCVATVGEFLDAAGVKEV